MPPSRWSRSRRPGRRRSRSTALRHRRGSTRRAAARSTPASRACPSRRRRRSRARPEARHRPGSTGRTTAPSPCARIRARAHRPVAGVADRGTSRRSRWRSPAGARAARVTVARAARIAPEAAVGEDLLAGGVELARAEAAHRLHREVGGVGLHVATLRWRHRRPCSRPGVRYQLRIGSGLSPSSWRSFSRLNAWRWALARRLAGTGLFCGSWQEVSLRSKCGEAKPFFQHSSRNLDEFEARVIPGLMPQLPVLRGTHCGTSSGGRARGRAPAALPPRRSSFGPRSRFASARMVRSETSERFMSTPPLTPAQLPLSVHCQIAAPSHGSSACGWSTPHSAWCRKHWAIAGASLFDEVGKDLGPEARHRVDARVVALGLVVGANELDDVTRALLRSAERWRSRSRRSAAGRPATSSRATSRSRGPSPPRRPRRARCSEARRPARSSTAPAAARPRAPP